MSPSASRIAVIMPAYNVGAYVAQAIESVLEQRVPVPYRLYIAEDCSTDDTRAICERYAARHPDRITLVCNPHNLGLPRSFSQVHNRIPEDYFCVLDGDDYYTDPDKLATQFALLEERPDVAVCAHNSQRVPEAGVPEILAIPPQVVDPSLPETTFTISDIARGGRYRDTNWRVYFATASLMYRNVFRHRVPDYFYDERGADEIIRTIMHCQFGTLLYQPAVMSAWRIRAGSRWNGLSYRSRMFKLLDWYAGWNQMLDYRYDAELTARSNDLVLSNLEGWRTKLRIPLHPVFFGGLMYRGARNLATHWWRRAFAPNARPAHTSDVDQPPGYS